METTKAIRLSGLGLILAGMFLGVATGIIYLKSETAATELSESTKASVRRCIAGAKRTGFEATQKTQSQVEITRNEISDTRGVLADASALIGICDSLGLESFCLGSRCNPSSDSIFLRMRLNGS